MAAIAPLKPFDLECIPHERGTCSFGDKCKYKHGKFDLRKACTECGASRVALRHLYCRACANAKKEDTRRASNRLCTMFANGLCMFESECRFKHGAYDARPVCRDCLAVRVDPKHRRCSKCHRARIAEIMKKLPCNNDCPYSKCPHGVDCIYWHGEDDKRSCCRSCDRVMVSPYRINCMRCDGDSAYGDD